MNGNNNDKNEIEEDVFNTGIIKDSSTKMGWFKNSSLCLHGYGLEIMIKQDGKQDSQEGLYENSNAFEESTFTLERNKIETYDGVNDFIA